MRNKIYRLVKPQKFQIQESNIDEMGDEVIVKPSFLAICHADQRYYKGLRAQEVLDKKLPMALIHEGIGIVEYDSTGGFSKGQLVAMVPNTPFEYDEVIAENYLRSSKFRASGFDGFMQEHIAMRRDRIVPVPDGIDKNVAAFTELVSVSYHTINRFKKFTHKRRTTLGVWGDGNLAYITALLLSVRLPESEIYIFGIDKTKMEMFDFVKQTYDVNEIPEDIKLDHAFECVGGKASGIAINQIIDYIQPEGTIAIMGVSEEFVPLNTRMILEKGLRIFGSSRCGSDDFRDTLKLYTEHPEIVEKLKVIIGEIITVKTEEDIYKAFEADAEMRGGKTVMIWDKD